MKIKVCYDNTVTTLEVPEDDFTLMIDIDYQSRLDAESDNNNWHKFDCHRSQSKIPYCKDNEAVDDIDDRRVTVNSRNMFATKSNKKEDSLFINLNTNSDKTIDGFIKNLIKACAKLQANVVCKSQKENIRNDYIRDMLSMCTYSIKDQTRRGCSSSGKSTGEVDIFVEYDDMPFTVVEALILDSLKKEYLNEHLDKIYNYDTTGNKFNICLIYVEAKNFEAFWNKYCEHVTAHIYPAPLVQYRTDADREFSYSEIRFMTTAHNRNGKLTLLYHVAVKM